MEPLTVFSWGYWGWGPHTERFVESADRIEASRGFAPPLFVDVRLSRSVRAPGFRDSAFAELLGRARHEWMPQLGNRALHATSGPPVVIADPSAAGLLLDLARTAARARRRTIFFCACEFPRVEGGKACHRINVGRLLLKLAQHQGQRLTLVEWPGAASGDIAICASKRLVAELQRGRKSLPFREAAGGALPKDLGWGTLATVAHERCSVRVITGPARWTADGWTLPILHAFAHGMSSLVTQRAQARGFRNRYGLEAKTAGPPTGASLKAGLHSPQTTLDPQCVYTILAQDKLDRIAAEGGSGSAHEGRAWTGGARLLAAATTAGRRLGILFADAADCSRLVYWALLTGIDAGPSGTHYRFEALRRLTGFIAPQELVLTSTGRRIAAGFIRPYAICHTPAFLLDGK